MYKVKLAIFGAIIITLIALTTTMFVVSSYITRENIAQSNIANTLLQEHQFVAGISYRIFKQYTDELFFDHGANQSEVRKKQELIEKSFDLIKDLEIKQRKALGTKYTRGSVEDTDELRELLNNINEKFENLIKIRDTNNSIPDDELKRLLEITIDKEFRDIINAAVNRQRSVVSSLNSTIETLNKSLFWMSILLAVLSVPIISLACYWLFNQLYQPLLSLKLGANSISDGNYQYRISRGFDSEFDKIAESFNLMAEQLEKQRSQLLIAQHELESEVARQTQEVTKANQLLSEKDKIRREFLADISHELRTPLTIIRGEAQVTLRQSQQSVSEYKTTLKVILDQSLSLSKLVDDLLLIARSENNQLRVIKESVSMTEFIDEITSNTSMLASRKGINVESSLSNNAEFGFFDRDRVSQLLSIFIDNAINYSPENSCVKLSCKVDEKLIEFTIADNGQGIDDSKKDHLFQRYFRASDSRMSEGAGLGLAIAKSIIDAHNGTVSFESSKNIGTTFVIILPNSGY